MAESKIDLTTTDEHVATVRIDGVAYGIRNPDWLPLFTYKRFQRLGEKLNAFDQKDELTPDDEVEASKILADQCAIVLDAPADVLAKLKDGQRVLVIDVFLELPVVRPATAAPATAPASTSPGTSSSPNSVDSSAETRAIG